MYILGMGWVEVVWGGVGRREGYGCRVVLCWISLLCFLRTLCPYVLVWCVLMFMIICPHVLGLYVLMYMDYMSLCLVIVNSYVLGLYVHPQDPPTVCVS